jgi:hypothetical protein
MPNAWITHVKNFAASHNISYACAVGDPRAKASYAKAPAALRKRRSPKEEKPMTKHYRKKVTPEQKEHAKVVKQRILDRITY